jgi:hypothetical protein
VKYLLSMIILVASGCASAPEIPEGLPDGFKGDALPVFTAFTLESPEKPSVRSTGEKDVFSFLDDTKGLEKDFMKPLVKDAPKLFAKISVIDPGGADPLEKAKLRRADLLVRMKPRKSDVTYVGRNLWFFPNLGIWFFTWFGAWYVPDETWAADMVMDMTVQDPVSGKTVLTKTLIARQELRLNDFHRGWNFLGTFLGPSMNKETFAEAGEHIQPFAFKRLKAEALRALAIDLRNALNAKGWKPRSETLVLILGHNGTNAKFAEKDAEAFKKFMGTQGVPSESMRTLKGKKASPANLIHEIKALERMPFPERKKVIIYFAGPGFTLVEETKDPRSGSKEAPPSAVAPAWETIAKKAPFPILLATQPGKCAHEAEDLGHGLFTATLLDGFKGAADLDKNKKVSLGELKKYLASQVKGVSQVLEKAQEPLLLGGREKEDVFSR